MSPSATIRVRRGHLKNDGLLRSMAASGESSAAIGKLLNRTALAIRRRARTLQIKLARSRPGPKAKQPRIPHHFTLRADRCRMPCHVVWRKEKRIGSCSNTPRLTRWGHYLSSLLYIAAGMIAPVDSGDYASLELTAFRIGGKIIVWDRPNDPHAPIAGPSCSLRCLSAARDCARFTASNVMGLIRSRPKKQRAG